MKCTELKDFFDKESGVDISDKSRERTYVTFRNWFYYFSYKYASDSYSFKYVGELLKRDHSTVIHCYRKFIDTYPFDFPMQRATEDIESKLCKHFNIEIINEKEFHKGKHILDVKSLRLKKNQVDVLLSRIQLLESELNKKNETIESLNKLLNEKKIYSQTVC